MLAADDLLRVYLRSLMEASGARTVSMFVPSGPAGSPEAFLIHDGEDPAVPELSGLAEAEEFYDRVTTPTRGVEETLRQFRSSKPGGLLISVSVCPDPKGAPRTEGRRQSDSISRLPDGRVSRVLIGLSEVEPDGVPRGGEDHVRWVDRDAWRSLLLMAGVLASYARDFSQILADPVTGLLVRVEFERRLAQAVSGAMGATQPSVLLLINPDDFGSINETYGPERGDEFLRLLGKKLRDCFRTSDIVARYGGAVFIALLNGVDEETGAKLGRKALEGLTEILHLSDSFRLTVSVGAACVDPDNLPERPGDLIRRAEQALRVAKCAGGGCVRFWDPAHQNGAVGELDELSGVFTGNPSKDYRNMKLLSRTVTAIAVSADFNELTSVVAARIHSTLRADRVALADWSDEGELRVISAVGPSGGGTQQPQTASFERDENLLSMLSKVRDEGRVVTSADDSAGQARIAFAVPLVAGDACLGTLYVDGRQGRIALDSNDVDFLQALASQLALALDRARLTQVEREWREEERRNLRAEIDELRQVFQKAELVCESQQMMDLMATVRRVAQTDATVLVCGESGTGKEMISRTVHDLGPRRDKPLVVVDCASIPMTLIESELFGHERGAYTGAQERKIGRLKEADRGTVILDEIGELPLEVQGKLLRFVQEKQLNPVGGNRVINVDARVVAATNRDLENEVRHGRFREDLFHRLNVIRLDVPPLRQRPSDILALADYFLRQFSDQYQKGRSRRLSSTAGARLLGYEWPGNVRELRNRIMQAVILSRTEEIGPDQLGLADSGSSPTAGPAVAVAESRDVTASPQPESVSAKSPWDALEAALEGSVRAAVAGDPADLPPLYRWLTDDLVVCAYEAASNVLTRGADLLGIPEATFRRKLNKALERGEDGDAQRSTQWSEVSAHLSDVVRAKHAPGEDVLMRFRNILLGHVIHCRPNRRAIGAALMGVTDPTYRRWVRDLESASTREEKAEPRAAYGAR